MYLEVFKQLGLSKNEAKIYEALLRSGECSVREISQHADVYRRNVYDALNRLLEKGLIFEILETKENRYQAVDPHKLMELVQEDEEVLAAVLPDLRKLRDEEPKRQQVRIYRGLEGWKKYLQDMLRVGDDVYILGGGNEWFDERVSQFSTWFFEAARDKNIAFRHLLDPRALSRAAEIKECVAGECLVLPEPYKATTRIDIFGDYVTTFSSVSEEVPVKEFVFTVMVDARLAESFRCWFRFIWDHLHGYTSDMPRFPEK